MVFTAQEFTQHACEQVLRFTRVSKWEDLSDEVKVQLSFNMGAMALGLSLSKEEGYLSLQSACNGSISMEKFHEHLKSLILSHKIVVDGTKVARPF